MGKSEKKGKKGTKKKKEGKKSKEDKMTFGEALLAYQIQMKESRIEELLTELKQVEEKNGRYKERNERLKAEQSVHVKELLSEAKDQEKELEKKEVVNREQVDEAIKDKWDYIRQKEILFEELRGEINGLEQQILLAEAEKDYRLQYKNVGSWEHAKQIHHLQEELRNIKQNFTEIDEYFKRSLEKTKHEIDLDTEKKMDHTREMATQDAVKHMDEESRKEIKEKEWLMKEVDIYRKDIHDLEASVCKTERENLQLINHLFDSRLQDLKISRNTFLTQMAGLDLPADGSLEDFANLDLDTTSGEDQGHRKTLTAEGGDIIYETDSSTALDLSHLLLEEEMGFKEHVHLGPLERKLLSVMGQTKPIHKQNAEPKLSEQSSGSKQRLQWPLTQRMIKSAFP
ncbi:coiled-coil domain-containing protein 83 isoform X2 [Hyla sarda]|nr:coiled-coil domain-containing protein 83 isoform X2 [Hyla sarda]XP_056417329.1 coiled-coil domain-containing protein 83 isoform X2 [Hyla sarda]XP_056417330.1 coiled-coil domain-containing protein 83 isoform X2 [Hyla sarda]XP_056417331.1 coiled-coil domain-containing protein 83 isoform X2 [Hyla sarda]XP_056417332.1 coiled-coil domain-containing protein 83 isoform X2 [Hyla sarda]